MCSPTGELVLPVPGTVRGYERVSIERGLQARGVYYSTFTSPWRMAYRTAWVRSLTCSLEKMLAV